MFRGLRTKPWKMRKICCTVRMGIPDQRNNVNKDTRQKSMGYVLATGETLGVGVVGGTQSTCRQKRRLKLLVKRSVNPEQGG